MAAMLQASASRLHHFNEKPSCMYSTNINQMALEINKQLPDWVSSSLPPEGSRSLNADHQMALLAPRFHQQLAALQEQVAVLRKAYYQQLQQNTGLANSTIGTNGININGQQNGLGGFGFTNIMAPLPNNPTFPQQNQQLAPNSGSIPGNNPSFDSLINVSLHELANLGNISTQELQFLLSEMAPLDGQVPMATSGYDSMATLSNATNMMTSSLAANPMPGLMNGR